MSARSTPVRAQAAANAKGKPPAAPVPDRGLRRLRLLFFAVVVACVVALAFELGVVAAPNPATLPLIGALWPKPPLGPATVSNYPKTAIVGHQERFSVQLPEMANQELTYVLEYPNGTQEQATVPADARGRSSHTFTLNGYTPTHWRETAYIGVENGAKDTQAFLRFAIQQDHAPSTK